MKKTSKSNRIHKLIQAKGPLLFTEHEEANKAACLNSISAKVPYCDRIFNSSNPVLRNNIASKSCYAFSQKTKLKSLKFNEIIKLFSQDKQREYLLKSNPKSVKMLAKTAFVEALEPLVESFIKHFPFGLPSVGLTKNLIVKPSLFSNLPHKAPPPVFKCNPMHYEEIVEDCTGVNSPTIKLWLHDFPLIASNLISICKLGYKRYNDNLNYEHLINTYQLALAEVACCKSSPSWEVSQLLVTAFTRPSVFSNLYKNCLAMTSKTSLFFYLEDLAMYMPHIDYITRENLRHHFLSFSKKLAEANLSVKKSKQKNIANTKMSNAKKLLEDIDVDAEYISIFGYDRDTTVAYISQKSPLGKIIIDVADGYEYGIALAQGVPSVAYKLAYIVLNCMKNLRVELQQLCTRNGISYIVDLIQSIDNNNQPTPPHCLKPYVKEIKSVVMVGMF